MTNQSLNQSSLSSSSGQAVSGGQIHTWLSHVKTAMLPSVKARIVETYSRHCIDISSKEAEDIAIMSVELAAVDVAELFSLQRFTDPIVCH